MIKLMKRVLCFLIFGSFTMNTYSQTIDWVLLYENVTSGFEDIDINASSMFMAGTIRPNGQPWAGHSVSGYGYQDGVLCKADTAGNINWVRVAGSVSGEKARFVRYHNNMLYLAGNVINWSGNSIMRIGSSQWSIPPFPSVTNGYVVQMDTSGNVNWIHFVPSDVQSFEIDAAGNAYASCSDSYRTYLYKFSSSGAQLFEKYISEKRYPCLLSTDPSGNIFLGINFSDSIVFFGNLYTGFGSSDILLSRLDVNGNPLSAVVIGGAGLDALSYIKHTANNNILITGVWVDTVQCNNVTISGTGNRHFIAALDPNLSFVMWNDREFRIPSHYITNTPNGNSILSDNGRYYISLNFEDTLIAGVDTLIGKRFGGYYGNGCVASFDAALNLLWYRTLAESSNPGYNTGHASVWIRPVGNRIYLSGQMMEQCIIDGISYNPSNNYHAFTALLTDTFQMSVGISEIRDGSADDWIVYPNPARDVFTVKLGHSYLSSTIQLADQTGRTLFFQKAELNLSHINMKNYPDGIYFMRINERTKKIVLMR
ncbi:MAG: T9SS C-terminal target domain-containing protein [Bacteroidetes bacterium]|nr:MAG: T9SS C-terminal target domain-containing protein [Bacteroidota bacterium]REK00987.1 MAG: T9SS C-terminal target domain-containing protein [Bacteroidota bacterium]REK34590.1 MAG: T9SS C-terminal target domain-containing protein [Bacteroidota bacterium]